MKTIDNTHRFYGLIRRAANELRCGIGGFEILADRPLNHGHLIVCKVWYTHTRRWVHESVYRFRIDEQDAVYIIDESIIRYGVWLPTRKGRDDEPVLVSPAAAAAKRSCYRLDRREYFLR